MRFVLIRVIRGCLLRHVSPPVASATRRVIAACNSAGSGPLAAAATGVGKSPGDQVTLKLGGEEATYRIESIASTLA